MHGRGDDNGAIAQYTEVIRLMPSLDRAWYGLGAIYHARRDWPKAIPHLQEAARLQYFNPYAGHLLATAYHFSGQPEKAREEWQRVQGFDPKVGAQIAREIGVTR
jgi:tetratricopeptide (TPR) repeat protein